MQQELMTPQPESDLSGMDYRQLTGLRERIDDRVREMRETVTGISISSTR